MLSAALMAGLAMSGCNKSDPATGPVTDPNAPITLTSPKGGETFHVGDTMWVKWTVKDDPVAPIVSVDLQISADNGKTWGFAKTGSVPVEAPSFGNFPYVVQATTVGTPQFSLLSSNCLFRVRSYTETNKLSVSPGTFTILAK